MWCANCNADVAAEVIAESHRIRCANCGNDLGHSGANEKTREARDLLERWSQNQMLDPYAPLTAKSPAVTSPSEDDPPPPEPRQQSNSKPKFRLDGAHPVTQQPAPEPPPAPAPSHSARYDHYHEAVPAPHYDYLTTTQREQQQAQTNQWTAMLGQLLAYGGVGVLTVGTCLVLLGYFGGNSSYAPTGWLIATAGQMLLFLGVITLVSGGMEQTTQEVTRRVERLGEHIIRIEQASRDHALRGPKTPGRKFAQPGSQAAEPHAAEQRYQ